MGWKQTPASKGIARGSSGSQGAHSWDQGLRLTARLLEYWDSMGYNLYGLNQALRLSRPQFPHL